MALDEAAFPPIRIRAFEDADEDEVVSLWQRCDLTRPWNDPRKDIDRKRMVRPDLFLVGVAEGRVVATVMAGYDGHRGWMNYLAVDPAYRRRGFARVIVRHAETLLRASGCPKVNIQVRRGNQTAVRFYRRVGFAEDEVLSFGKRLVPDTPDSEGANTRPA